MKQVKLLGLALIAMLSLSGLVAAASQAAATLPSALPNSTFAEAITGTNSSGETTFAAGALKLSSPSSSGTQEGFSPKLGLFITTFLGFNNMGIKCTGLNKTTTGEVEMLGTYHLRDYNIFGVLHIADIFLLLPVHFTCSGTLLVVSGCVAGQATPENTLTKTITVSLKATSNGKDNEIITVLNEVNTVSELCQLLAKQGAASTELSVLVQESMLTGFKQNGVAITILLMPL
jgi:hypothetical protein